MLFYELFETLPYSTQQKVVSKLANDIPSLTSILLASKVFAARFDDPALWKLLIRERWGKKQIIRDDLQLAGLKSLYVRRVYTRDFLHDVENTEDLKYTATFQDVTPGTYRVVHASDDRRPRGSAVTFTAQGTGTLLTMKGKLMDKPVRTRDSDNVGTIDVRTSCDITVTVSAVTMYPPEAKYVQLKPVAHGEKLYVDPVWMCIEYRTSYPRDTSIVGREDNGDSLWISLLTTDRSTSGAPLHPAVNIGKIGSHLCFHGSIGDHKEWLGGNGANDFTFILMNQESFEWVEADVNDVEKLASTQGVSLGHDNKGQALFATRINFYGWKEVGTLVETKTTGRIISVLPGKYTMSAKSPAFTWGGHATDGRRVKLRDGQKFDLLCYKLCA